MPPTSGNSSARADKHVTTAAVAAVVLAAGGAAAWALNKRQRSSSSSSLPLGAFDVAVVGSGVAGSTAAYYLAKGGARVVLLEKEKSISEKPCDGTLAFPAVRVLNEMGILAELQHDIAEAARSEGAPATGLRVPRPRLDSALRDAAVSAGADLRRGFEVSGLATSFDSESKTWTVRSTRSSFAGSGRASSEGGEALATGHGNEGGSIAARLLILADGASSDVGRELGFVDAAGAEGGGDAVVPSPLEDDAAAPARARRQRSSSRGVPRSHGDHWMICGEAAGHAEAVPFAKEEEASPSPSSQGAGNDERIFHGIHTAMVGAKLAAECALEMRARGDHSSSATGRYERAWRREFGTRAVDAWPRAVRDAVKSLHPRQLLDAALAARDEKVGRARELLSSTSTSLRESVAATSSSLAAGVAEVAASAEAAGVAIHSAASSVVAAARRSLSGDGAESRGGASDESVDGVPATTSGGEGGEERAGAATASVEVKVASSDAFASKAGAVEADAGEEQQAA